MLNNPESTEINCFQPRYAANFLLPRTSMYPKAITNRASLCHRIEPKHIENENRENNNL